MASKNGHENASNDNGELVRGTSILSASRAAEKRHPSSQNAADGEAIKRSRISAQSNDTNIREEVKSLVTIIVRKVHANASNNNKEHFVGRILEYILNLDAPESRDGVSPANDAADSTNAYDFCEEENVRGRNSPSKNSSKPIESSNENSDFHAPPGRPTPASINDGGNTSEPNAGPSDFSHPEASTALPKLRNDDPNIHMGNPEYRYNCVICNKSGLSRLERHYIRSHPEYELMTSRLSPDFVLKTAAPPEPASVSDAFRMTAMCYFCEDRKDYDWNYWPRHILSHTGEFNYLCTNCNETELQKPCNKKNCKNKIVIRLFKYGFSDGYLSAYICKKCHYVQVNEENLAKHVTQQHAIKQNVSTNYAKFHLLTFLPPIRQIDVSGVKTEDRVKVEGTNHKTTVSADSESDASGRTSNEQNATGQHSYFCHDSLAMRLIY